MDVPILLRDDMTLTIAEFPAAITEARDYAEALRVRAEASKAEVAACHAIMARVRALAGNPNGETVVTVQDLRRRAEAAEAEVEELRDALISISEGEYGDPEWYAAETIKRSHDRFQPA